MNCTGHCARQALSHKYCKELRQIGAPTSPPMSPTHFSGHRDTGLPDATPEARARSAALDSAMAWRQEVDLDKCNSELPPVPQVCCGFTNDPQPAHEPCKASLLSHKQQQRLQSSVSGCNAILLCAAGGI